MRACLSAHLCACVNLCVYIRVCPCLCFTDVANCEWALEDLLVSPPITFYKLALAQAYSHILANTKRHTHTGFEVLAVGLSV